MRLPLWQGLQTSIAEVSESTADTIVGNMMRTSLGIHFLESQPAEVLICEP